MQKIKGILALSMFALPMLVACPEMGGEEPDGAVSCDPEDPSSCDADDELCHPYARVCVANCALQEGACEETALPTCGTEEPFTNICFFISRADDPAEADDPVFTNISISNL